MPKYNHAYDFSFEVVSNRDDAEDVTPAMIREALLARVGKLTDEQLFFACGCFDTVEVEGDDPYGYSCDDPDCACRQDHRWPDNIKNGCAG